MMVVKGDLILLLGLLILSTLLYLRRKNGTKFGSRNSYYIAPSFIDTVVFFNASPRAYYSIFRYEAKSMIITSTTYFL